MSVVPNAHNLKSYEMWCDRRTFFYIDLLTLNVYRSDWLVFVIELSLAVHGCWYL